MSESPQHFPVEPQQPVREEEEGVVSKIILYKNIKGYIS